MTTEPSDDRNEPDAAPDVTGALATLVADEPPLRTTVEDAERQGRALLVRRRRRRAGAAGGVLAAGVAALLAGGPVGQLAAGPQPGPSPTPSAASADPAPSDPAPPDPAPSDPGVGGPIDGTSLPVGFPVGEAFAALQGALPDDVTIGELPADVGWRPAADGTTPELEVPLVTGGGDAVVARLTLGDPCALTGARPVLRAAQARAAAEVVCTTWASWGSPDPLAPVPSPDVPPDPAS
jgi:hypothetical protein